MILARAQRQVCDGFRRSRDAESLECPLSARSGRSSSALFSLPGCRHKIDAATFPHAPVIHLFDNLLQCPGHGHWVSLSKSSDHVFASLRYDVSAPAGPFDTRRWIGEPNRLDLERLIYFALHTAITGGLRAVEEPSAASLGNRAAI